MNFPAVPVFKEGMGDAVQDPHRRNGSASPLEHPVSVAVLSCTGCGAVTRVKLGSGSLTCDCGADRRIVRIVEEVPREPKGQ